MDKFARITGNCLLTSQDGTVTEVLTGRVGKCTEVQKGAVVLKIGNCQFPVPNCMLEMVNESEIYKENLL